MATKIIWTDETWNPVTGCTKYTSGCATAAPQRWQSGHSRAMHDVGIPFHFK